MVPRHPRVHGARDVRGALRRVGGRVRVRHVHAGDGHRRVPLQRVQRARADLQEGRLGEPSKISNIYIKIVVLYFSKNIVL